MNKKVDVNATQFKCSNCGTMNTISAEGRLKAQKNARVVVFIAVGIVGAIVIATVLNGNNNKGTTNNSLDQRTCEIARDIAGSFNVTDTIAKSQQRVADLYSGYGEAASPAIAAGIRQWAAGMTSDDYNEAAAGVSAVNSACSSEGF